MTDLFYIPQIRSSRSQKFGSYGGGDFRKYPNTNEPVSRYKLEYDWWQNMTRNFLTYFYIFTSQYLNEVFILPISSTISLLRLTLLQINRKKVHNNNNNWFKSLHVRSRTKKKLMSVKWKYQCFIINFTFYLDRV